jgi:hypothetical protein
MTHTSAALAHTGGPLTPVQFIKKSSNGKIGTMPCTTSPRSTCPPACPLSGDKGACYAEAGFFTRMNWDKVDKGDRGAPFTSLLESIGKLKEGTVWRHNVAGDLQGSANVIDTGALAQLTEANRGRKGFTYTHYPVFHSGNRNAVRKAITGGFTVNISCNTPTEATETKALTGLPVVTLVPNAEWWAGKARKGDIVRCPAETSESITCKSCKLCQVATRADIVGFTAHGTQARKAEVIASAS